MQSLTKELRKVVEQITTRHFFYSPSAHIYGGTAGLYDYGPLGCRLKNNIIDYWREFFIIGENMSEVECATLTPEIVLKTSGHVEKFQDVMVKDIVTNEGFRADHLLEKKLCEILEKEKLSEEKRNELQKIKNSVGGFNLEEIKEEMKKLNVKSPLTGNDLSDPYHFNLMFSTPIGPTGKVKGYLRPETAQGIFVNFKKLLEERGGKLPFAVAQIGTSYRNEIAPRSGLLRVREFTMAEIEHFCKPDEEKRHKKFKDIKETEIQLWTKNNQMSNISPEKLTIKKAVEKKIIANETLGFYISKTFDFLVDIGISSEHLRFRQHLPTEMAHYAVDCWDAEINTSFGWIECVGLADRACYDLTQHSKVSKTELSVFVPFDEPKRVSRKVISLNIPLIGKTFKANKQVFVDKICSLKGSEIDHVEETLSKDGEIVIKTEAGEFCLKKEMVFGIELVEETLKGFNYVPSVVEPSFGLGRIMYALLEHSYRKRTSDDKTEGQKNYLSFNARMSPIKCVVAPLSNGKELKLLSEKIVNILSRNNIATQIENSNTSIGKKYARSDEKGAFLCLTVDFDSLKDESFTIRTRDSMEQIRIQLGDAVSTIKGILYKDAWTELYRKYGLK